MQKTKESKKDLLISIINNMNDERKIRLIYFYARRQYITAKEKEE